MRCLFRVRLETEMGQWLTARVGTGRGNCGGTVQRRFVVGCHQKILYCYYFIFMCPRCYLHKDGRSFLWLRVRILGSGWCRFGFRSLAGQAQKAFRSLISHCKFLCQRLCVCVLVCYCVCVCVWAVFGSSCPRSESQQSHTL